MNRLSVHLLQTMLTVLTFVPSACLAAAGDVSFRAADKTIQLNPADLTSAIDVFFEVEGLMNVPATGWGMIVNITPQAGATGTVQFNPPTIVNNEPNLMPSSQNPFLDFDRDFGGMSYGMLGDSATQLRAFSYYIAPTLGPAPSLDANGNLSLPDGSGLVSLPIMMSVDAFGDFIVTFDPDTAVTGATFATGMPAPNDVGIHPVGPHIAGILSVINPAGDYNRNRVVDAADYVVWRKNDGTQAGYDTWRANFGKTTGSGSLSSTMVPEPAGALLLILGAVVGTWGGRRITSCTIRMREADR